MVVWAFSSAEVIDNPMRQKNFVVNRDHVVTSAFVASGYKFVLFNPFQTTGMLISQFQGFLNNP